LDRRDDNRLDFRFLGTGGSATGRWGIAAFVVLGIWAMVTVVLLAKTAPFFASALGGLASLRGR